MSQVQPVNDHPEIEDAVDLLIDRFGHEEAEWRVLLALSEVRKRQYREARQ